MALVSIDPVVLRPLLRQWAIYLLDSVRRDESPGADEIGEFQAARQTNPNVWFVAGSFGNANIITRDMVVPADRGLFCVPASVDASTAERPGELSDRLTTPEQLRQRAEGILEKFNEAYVEIDPDRSDGRQRYSINNGLTKVVTEPFNIQFIARNPYAIEYNVGAEPADMICAAQVAYVGPLSVGNHKINIYSKHDADAPLNIRQFQVNVSYNLTIIQKIPLTGAAQA